MVYRKGKAGGQRYMLDFIEFSLFVVLALAPCKYFTQL